MKRLKKGLGLLTSCVLMLSMTVGQAGAAVYDSTWTAGEPAATEESGQTSYLYPGDSIANTQIFLGEDPVETGTLEDGMTPGWTNRSGKVYRISVRTVEGEPSLVLDENGNPVPEYDAEGNPVVDPETQEIRYQVTAGEGTSSYVLDTVGGTVEVVDGSQQSDSFSDLQYSLPYDAVYYFTDASGNPAQISSQQITAAAYPLETTVNLKAADKSAEGLQFQRWSLYKVEGDSLTSISDDTLMSDPSFIPGLSPEMLTADPLSYTVRGAGARIIFMPVYAAAQAVPEEQTPQTDPATGYPIDPGTGYVIDPATGMPVDPPEEQTPQTDPATGYPIDPLTGYVIDPSTGQPVVDASQEIPGGTSDISILNNTQENELNIMNTDEYGTQDELTLSAQSAPDFVTALYSITLTDANSNPEDVSALAEGTEVSIAAVSKEGDGLEFDSWSAEGIQLREDQIISPAILITMPAANITLTANYRQKETQPPVYTLTLSDASSNPDAASGLTEGTEVDITAADKDAEGLVFDGWSAEGIQLGEEQAGSPQIHIAMPAANVALTANYRQKETQPPVYTLTLSDASSNPDAASGLTEGTEVDIMAADKDAEGLAFDGWSAEGIQLGEEQAGSPQIHIAMPAANVALTANYRQKETQPPVYTLTLSDASSNPDAASGLTEGTEVDIIASDKDAEGLVFDGWSAEGIQLGEEQAGSPQIHIAMPAANVALKANYKEKTPTETITAVNATIENVETKDNGDGSVSATVDAGTTVKITANEAPENQQFEHWNVSSPAEVTTSSTTDPTIEVTLSAADVTVEPVFTAQASEPVFVFTQPSAGGRINETPEVTTVDANQEKYVFTLTTEAGYKVNSFTATSGSQSSIVDTPTLSDDNKKLTFTANKTDPADTITITATLSVLPHSLTVNSGTGSGSYEVGTVVNIAANSPQAGWRFTKWTVSVAGTAAQGTGNGTIASDTEASTTFTMGGADVTVTANYEQIPYTLTVNSGSGGGTHVSGEAVVITADPPQTGYRFRNWSITSGSGKIASDTASQTTFTMEASDAVVTANYELIPYTLTVKNGSGSGTFTMGTTTSITPNFPASGKEFDHWEKTSGKINFDNVHNYYATVTMKASDATVTAIYKDGPNPNNNQITGLEHGAEYLKSTTLTFTAVGAGMENRKPNPGDYRYRPASYQIGSVGGSWTSSPYTTSMAINAVGDYTLTVTYAKDVYDGSSWNPDGTSVTKSITFHVVNALSVKTGDSSPLIPLAIAGGAALAVIIILLVVLRKRRRR